MNRFKALFKTTGDFVNKVFEASKNETVKLQQINFLLASKTLLFSINRISQNDKKK